MGADAIEAYVNAELKKQQIPGLALGIFHNGQPLRLQAFGLASVELQVPVRPDTMFQAGSIGKMFTAAAVLALVEDGKADLDTSIRTYLPDAPSTWQAVTLRRLLNHTAGLGDTELDLTRDYSDDDLLRAYYATPTEFAPGQRWAYSNPGYATAGILVRRLSGKHYSEILKERIFEPAGMRTAQLIHDRDIVPNRAASYVLGQDGLKNRDWVSPALNSTGDGSLLLSLLDYGRWDAIVSQRGLLRPTSWQLALTPAPLNNGTTYPYGFGWELDKGPDGQPVIGHSGAWQGFRTDLRRYDGDGITFVVLANLGSADVGRILQGVAERHDPRYRQAPLPPLSDARPALSRQIDQVLKRIGQGKAGPADLPGIDAQQSTRLLAQAGRALKDAGECQPLTLVRDDANGDRLERGYRAACTAGSIEIAAEFDRGSELDRTSDFDRASESDRASDLDRASAKLHSLWVRHNGPEN